VIVVGPDSLLERWNGTSWSIVPGPEAPPNAAMQLVSITCPAANDCFAAGNQAVDDGHSFVVKPIVVRWNGSTWSTMPIPKPAGTPYSELNAIDCANPTSCVAVGDELVGDFETDSIQTHAIIERWDGTAWSPAAFPTPAGSAQEFLSSVSCADASNCLAVGAYLEGSTTKPLVERETGTTWSVVAAPILAGEDGAGFIDVACTSSTACFAVGDAFNGDDLDETAIDPLAEHWNGTAFSVDNVPLAPGADGGALFGIACTSATDCSAVGGSVTAASDGLVFTPLNEQWNGTTWSVATSPAATPFSELDELACPSASACFAVGDSALVEQWNGASWSLSPLAAKSSQSELEDVSCTDAQHCVAVGLYSGNAGPQSLAEHGSGSQWHRVAVPNRAGSTNAALIAVDCVTATNCTAVGGAGDADGPRFTLIEHWNGAAWSVVPSPSPAGASFVELLDVSCGAANRCNALGIVENNGAVHSFGAHWNGAAWFLDTIPTSDFASGVSLSSLSCPTAKTCFAVGSYQVVTGSRQVFVRTLLLRWNGYRWLRRAGATIPGDPPFAQLIRVSCSSDSQCLAVGLALDQGTGGGILNERWDGKKWSIAGSGRTLFFLPSGLVCRSGVSCYAVGNGFSAEGIGPAVAHWNGKTWANVSAEVPAGSSGSGLFGVDCPTRTVCYAAGGYQTVLGSFTLVLRGT
jgi:hypothetical protein